MGHDPQLLYFIGPGHDARGGGTLERALHPSSQTGQAGVKAGGWRAQSNIAGGVNGQIKHL
jgi:hypothetical protein